jgi:lysophospholipase L1-like esterase
MTHRLPPLVAAASLALLCVPLRGADATDWKFSFGPEKPPAGYVQVSPDAIYSKDTGYGYEPGSKVSAIERPASHDLLHQLHLGGNDALKRGFITGTAPIYFSVRLPEGNYRVTIHLGDAAGESTTTVKAELRRLMLLGVHTDAGQFATRTFTVALRRPQYPGGEVRLKPREKTSEAWAWDDRMTLEFTDRQPAVSAIEISPANDLPVLFLIGDSTMTDQPREPHNSWGQMITQFFGPGIVVSSHAESGESARSMFGERRWPKVMSVIKPGDYLIVQFGHNDQHDPAPGSGAYTSYKTFLKQFVADTRRHGATPILVTPMNRLAFEGDKLVNTLGDYPDAMRQEAKEDNVPLIDLNAMSKVVYEALGPKGAPAIFAAGPTGRVDTTHQGDYGSYELSQCVVAGIRSEVPALARYLNDDAPHFDPAHPDPFASFSIPKELNTTTERPYGN